MTIRPTKRAVALGGGALLLFAVGTNVQAGWVLVVAALLLGILVAGSLLPLWALNGIEVAREVPRSAFAGDPMAVTIVVSNTSRRLRALFGVSDDFLGRSHAVVGAIAGGGSRSYRSTRQGARRGVHSGGVCVLHSAAPFGVLRVKRALRVGSEVIVYPRTYDATSWRMRGPAGWPAPSSMGDVSTVREYRPGDPLRHIHWRSAARRGQLMVREFDREVTASTAVVVDVGDRLDVADAVASIACSIATAALREGPVSVGGRRMRSSDAILEWGARLVPETLTAALQLQTGDAADSIVYVGTPALAGVGRLRAAAAEAPMSAVLVDDGAGADAVAAQLRAAGAKVAIVEPAHVQEWFSTGCIAS